MSLTSPPRIVPRESGAHRVEWNPLTCQSSLTPVTGAGTAVYNSYSGGMCDCNMLTFESVAGADPSLNTTQILYTQATRLQYVANLTVSIRFGIIPTAISSMQLQLFSPNHPTETAFGDETCWATFIGISSAPSGAGDDGDGDGGISVAVIGGVISAVVICIVAVICVCRCRGKDKPERDRASLPTYATATENPSFNASATIATRTPPEQQSSDNGVAGAYLQVEGEDKKPATSRADAYEVLDSSHTMYAVGSPTPPPATTVAAAVAQPDPSTVLGEDMDGNDNSDQVYEAVDKSKKDDHAATLTQDDSEIPPPPDLNPFAATTPDTESLPAIAVELALTSADLLAYRALWSGCGAEDGVLKAKTALVYFSRSGLEQAVLRKIWGIADSDSPKGQLTETDFFRASKLVALAQSGVTQLSIDIIGTPCGLPKETGPANAESEA